MAHRHRNEWDNSPRNRKYSYPLIAVILFFLLSLLYPFLFPFIKQLFFSVFLHRETFLMHKNRRFSTSTNFEGTIPPNYGNLVNLRYLFVFFLSLSLSLFEIFLTTPQQMIPKKTNKLKKNSEISQTQIGGTIPPDLGNCLFMKEMFSLNSHFLFLSPLSLLLTLLLPSPLHFPIKTFFIFGGDWTASL